MSNYWEERAAKAQAALTNKSIAQTEKQLKLYYQSTFKKTLDNFEKTYKKIFQRITKGEEVTPADLYKLDTYWQMQAQLKAELQKLGDKQVALLSKNFVKQYQSIYESLALPGGATFTQIDKATVEQMINQIWVADGKSWSSRIWTNTEKLADTLNEHLIHCVATGKTPGELKKLLQEDFGVSYGRADSLVRTELAHIQTQAAQKRYEDYGIKEVEVLADKDERRCEICGNLHKKRFPINAQMPVPAHPRCRCCIIPVIKFNNKPLVNDKKNQFIPVENQPLTLQNNSDNIVLDKAQKKAQEKVQQLQQQGQLKFYQHTERHQQHAEKLTGLVGDEAWNIYVRKASEFMKENIDGVDFDGFMSKANWLFKYQQSTGQFGLLSDKGTISTFFIPDNPQQYWMDQIIKYKE